ncbi:unnamed protein product [Allacma fusca]|uniref:Uncharacterized protein n=1 Tax=Allacma fusca TaxID=39272 RepID=A0A8J2NWW1_9HEXA|nr:unnamed protein product [Allacma fusca]
MSTIPVTMISLLTLFVTLALVTADPDGDGITRSSDVSDVANDLAMMKKILLKEIKKIKTQIGKLENAQAQTNTELENAKLPPVGFIYIQYGGQPEPRDLWKGGSWDNISPKYAGLFFRVEGGKSKTFGTTQDESMRQLKFEFQNKDVTKDEITQSGILTYSQHSSAAVTAGGWKGAWIGFKATWDPYGSSYAGRERDNEVRPINQAVKVWKRTD